MKLIHISEKIRDHLLSQVAQSKSLGHCKYRCEGNMCAVGCLITDQAYHDGIEDAGINNPLVKQALFKSLKVKLDHHGLELLRLWQTYHDNCMTIFDTEGDKSAGWYSHWIEEGADPTALNSPAVAHEILVAHFTKKGADMSAEVTKKYIGQVSMFIADHLVEQGKRSINTTTNNCRYRGPEGAMCAVGCIIDDAHYDEDNHEGVNVSALKVAQAVAVSLHLNVNDMTYGSPMYYMLRTWQKYHDGSDGLTSNFTLAEVERLHTVIMLNIDSDQFPTLL